MIDFETARRRAQARKNRALNGPMTATEIEMSWERSSPFKPMPPLVDPVRNHTELAERIADLRKWERLTGVPTPTEIELTIQAWELDR